MLKNLLFHFFILHILFLKSSNAGMGIHHAAEAVDRMTQEIDKLAHEMPSAVETVFRNCMDYIMDNVILPLIDDIQALFVSDYKMIYDELDKTLDLMTNNTIKVFKKGAQIALKFENQTADIIQKKIIDGCKEDILIIEKVTMSDLDHLLNEIIDLVHSIECEVDKAVLHLDLMLKSLNYIGEKVNRNSPCRLQLKLGGKKLDDLDPIQLYNLLKCGVKEKAMTNYKLQDIVLDCGILQQISSSLACIYDKSPILVKYFTKEYMQWSKYGYIWEGKITNNSTNYQLNNFLKGFNVDKT